MTNNVRKNVSDQMMWSRKLKIVNNSSSESFFLTTCISLIQNFNKIVYLENFPFVKLLAIVWSYFFCGFISGPMGIQHVWQCNQNTIRSEANSTHSSSLRWLWTTSFLQHIKRLKVKTTMQILPSSMNWETYIRMEKSLFTPMSWIANVFFKRF